MGCFDLEWEWGWGSPAQSWPLWPHVGIHQRTPAYTGPSNGKKEGKKKKRGKRKEKKAHKKICFIFTE